MDDGSRAAAGGADKEAVSEGPTEPQQQRRRVVGRQGYGWQDKPGGVVVDKDTGQPYTDSVVQILKGRAESVEAAAELLSEHAAPLEAHFGIAVGFYLPDGTASWFCTAGGVYDDPDVKAAIDAVTNIMRAKSIALVNQRVLAVRWHYHPAFLRTPSATEYCGSVRLCSCIWRLMLCTSGPVPAACCGAILFGTA